MQHTEGKFTGAKSTELYYQKWKHDDDPRAVIVIVHGFGEHSGRYSNYVKHFVPCGYAVYGFDHRGHGRSPGKRGHINEWSEFRDDVRAFVQLVLKQKPNKPIFMLGHSLGGLIALEYVLHYPEGLKGIIASGPLLTQPGLSPVVIAMSKILSRIAPSVAIKTGLDASAISRDAAVVKAYQTDPLVHSFGTPRLSTEITAAQNWTYAHAADLKLPLLLIVGSEDKLVPPAGGRKFFDAVTFADKQKLDYQGAYHETHNDIIAPQVMADVERWLQAHLKS
ncbi:MAG: alpha/beta hydrolase [Chloroflexi bacterium]|nr:alpha/beta hydrolase [Chloroflexota bacterium]